jgi:hypothetical protein
MLSGGWRFIILSSGICSNEGDVEQSYYGKHDKTRGSLAMIKTFLCNMEKCPSDSSIKIRSDSGRKKSLAILISVSLVPK